jgi:hypothetical protein
MGFEEHEAWKRAVHTLLPIKLTFREQIEMLDRFFATPENRRIPIYWAIALCKGKAEEFSQAQFDTAVENARRAAPSASQP